MRAGLFLPIFDELADPALLGDLAGEAEAVGWDGVFLWDHVYYRPPVRAVTDPWIALACVATNTSTIVLGPMVTPIARRRPHVLARQVVAVDHLSSGRLVLGVGLGLDSSGGELSRFGEELDDRRRAEHLDEGLSLLTALLSGDRVDHHGDAFTATDVEFHPTPVNGHVPVWVAARRPNQRPLRRAAAHDGAFIIDLASPGDLESAVATIASHRPQGLDGYDIVVELAAGEDTEPWARAGATWWLASFDPFTVTAAEIRRTIRRFDIVR